MQAAYVFLPVPAAMPPLQSLGATGLWLLHGAMQDRRQFLPLLAQLPERLPVLLSDLAGHGQRREHWRHLEPLDPAALAADLLERQPQAGRSGPLWLVGHSLGALVALALAQRLAGQGVVAGLILGDPPLLPRDIPAALQAGALASTDPLEQRLVADSFFNFQHDGPYFEQLAALAETLPVQVLLGLQGAFRSASGYSDCGTLVGLASRERLLALATERPGLGLHGIADAGHFVFHAPSGQALVARLLA
ncbi:alpha/beta hydrolase [Cyanobium sp. Cruz-8H5]|uniref:alpha/beta hydrolase n=2 Tax=unclassified Cyanobium TaxID=2627006 RepID=UPI0020CDF55E|nr:alpha/beta hydrolase [Cyanobium sp. Cruz-8H5]MCP9858187.1 alpha/beta hydrolase [Cyanobium sp. Cruz-8H5]MCP9868306.1 alpha/beta hydrolase [Cyanobium sp. Cruz-8D1]